MARKRGRRSTQKPIDELIAEIREARKQWDALPLEERLEAGREKSEPTHRRVFSRGGMMADFPAVDGTNERCLPSLS
jgi:hypothetical protein